MKKILFISILFSITCTISIYFIFFKVNRIRIKPYNFKNNVIFQNSNVTKPIGLYSFGIDISHYQDSIDWNNLKYNNSDSINYVIIKATEGINYIDKQFAYNWLGASKVNIKKGAYHFFRADRDIDSQILNYIKNVPLKDKDLPPILDFEHTCNQSDDTLKSKIRHWLFQIERYYKVKPIIYTNKNLHKRIIKPYFSQYPLWIAHYDTTTLKDTSWQIWQFSNKSNISGIRGYVDINAMKLK